MRRKHIGHTLTEACPHNRACRRRLWLLRRRRQPLRCGSAAPTPPLLPPWPRPAPNPLAAASTAAAVCRNLREKSLLGVVGNLQKSCCLVEHRWPAPPCGRQGDLREDRQSCAFRWRHQGDFSFFPFCFFVTLLSGLLMVSMFNWRNGIGLPWICILLWGKEWFFKKGDFLHLWLQMI